MTKCINNVLLSVWVIIHCFLINVAIIHPIGALKRSSFPDPLALKGMLFLQLMDKDLSVASHHFKSEVDGLFA